ncbi:hydrogenase expression/formation protein HupG (plasmid) [Sinorhizobium americanum CCGM7]|nr:hydrogenase expression/formation protein HupG [Sinorhizobium americanum CCGM7]
MVCRTANGRLKGRPNVVVPSLTAIGRERPEDVVGKVRDRSVNVGKFGGRFFSGASIKVPTGGPKIAITHAARAILR